MQKLKYGDPNDFIHSRRLTRYTLILIDLPLDILLLVLCHVLMYSLSTGRLPKYASETNSKDSSLIYTHCVTSVAAKRPPRLNLGLPLAFTSGPLDRGNVSAILVTRLMTPRLPCATKYNVVRTCHHEDGTKFAAHTGD